MGSSHAPVACGTKIVSSVQAYGAARRQSQPRGVVVRGPGYWWLYRGLIEDSYQCPISDVQGTTEIKICSVVLSIVREASE